MQLSLTTGPHTLTVGDNKQIPTRLTQTHAVHATSTDSCAVIVTIERVTSIRES